MTKYASGKTSKAVCDRCGFSYPYKELRAEWTGVRVCRDCYDKKHERLTPTKKDLSDPKPLRHPRPRSPAPDYNPADDLANFKPSTAGQRYTPQ